MLKLTKKPFPSFHGHVWKNLETVYLSSALKVNVNINGFIDALKKAVL